MIIFTSVIPKEDQNSGIMVQGMSVSIFLLDKAKTELCNLFALVDSARNEEVFKYFMEGHVEYRSLFQGTADEKFFGISGFLVECKKDSVLFTWLTSEPLSYSSSIFFISKASFNDVFKHFQKFNRVYLEDDDIVYFRYYDPRILRIYLPTCNNKEIGTFFGEIKSFFMESENPEFLSEFQNNSMAWSNRLLISNYKINKVNL